MSKLRTSIHAAGEYIVDRTFIREMEHIQAVPFHQYDVLFATHRYEWENIIEWDACMAETNLENSSQMATDSTVAQEINITEYYNFIITKKFS